MVGRGVTAFIDEDLKELLDRISEREGISQREASRELVKEITGGSIFELDKGDEVLDREGERRRRNLFG